MADDNQKGDVGKTDDHGGKSKGESFLSWAYHSVMKDGSLGGLFRESIKDIGHTFHQAAWGQSEAGHEIGAPLSPLASVLEAAKEHHAEAALAASPFKGKDNAAAVQVGPANNGPSNGKSPSLSPGDIARGSGAATVHDGPEAARTHSFSPGDIARGMAFATVHDGPQTGRGPSPSPGEIARSQAGVLAGREDAQVHSKGVQYAQEFFPDPMPMPDVIPELGPSPEPVPNPVPEAAPSPSPGGTSSEGQVPKAGSFAERVGGSKDIGEGTWAERIDPQRGQNQGGSGEDGKTWVERVNQQSQDQEGGGSNGNGRGRSLAIEQMEHDRDR